MMRAERARKPRAQGAFRYAPDGAASTYAGEMREEWVITGVPETYTPLIVAQCNDLPQPGDFSTESGYRYWCVARLENVTDTAEKNTWRATVVYVPDPGSLPVEIYYSTIRATEAVETDLDGVAIVNSAGDLFNPPVTEARCHIRLRVVKRWRSDAFDNAFVISEYAAHVNSAPVIIPGLGTVESRHLYCGGIDAQLVQEPIWHYVVTYDLEVDLEKGFDTRLLNRGYAYLDEHGKRRAFKTDEGVAHGQPGLLNEQGGKTDAAGANYLTFHTKPEADFNELGLF